MGRLTISYHAFANQFRRYYGSVGPIYSVFNLSIDGSKLQRLNAKSNLYLDQHLIGSNNSLGPGRHTITLMHDAPIPAWNFFQSVICGVVKVNIGLSLSPIAFLCCRTVSSPGKARLCSSHPSQPTGFGVLPNLELMTH